MLGLLDPPSRPVSLPFQAQRSSTSSTAFFYDGPGTSVPVGGVHVNGSTTVFVNNFKGWIFQSAVHASLATSLTQIRVGGLIRDSD